MVSTPIGGKAASMGVKIMCTSRQLCFERDDRRNPRPPRRAGILQFEWLKGLAKRRILEGHYSITSNSIGSTVTPLPLKN